MTRIKLWLQLSIFLIRVIYWCAPYFYDIDKFFNIFNIWKNNLTVFQSCQLNCVSGILKLLSLRTDRTEKYTYLMLTVSLGVGVPFATNCCSKAYNMKMHPNNIPIVVLFQTQCIHYRYFVTKFNGVLFIRL